MSGGALPIVSPCAGAAYNHIFQEVVSRHRLLDFDRVMGLEPAQVIKAAVPERSTVRVLLREPAGSVALYLKRHHPAACGRNLRRLISLLWQPTAWNEFKNIVAFHQAGIPTMLPVAAGLRRRRLVLRESFLITQELAGCRRLDHFLTATTRVPSSLRRRLAEQLAQVVRRMHDRGFNHRDLYLCHVLINAAGKLFIVDLHRVDQRSRVPERWRVKDLAALNYSAPAAASRTDRLHFFKHYLGVQRLAAPDKALAGKILKKTEKMVQHSQRHAQGAC